MLILAFGGEQETAVRVTEIIMAGAGVVAYVIAEGLIDAANVGADIPDIGFAGELQPPDEEE